MKIFLSLVVKCYLVFYHEGLIYQKKIIFNFLLIYLNINNEKRLLGYETGETNKKYICNRRTNYLRTQSVNELENV